MLKDGGRCKWRAGEEKSRSLEKAPAPLLGTRLGASLPLTHVTTGTEFQF